MHENRWLDRNSPATKLERALVRSVVDVEPPAGAEAAGWAGLVARLGIPPGGGDGPGTGGAEGAADIGTGAAGASAGGKTVAVAAGGGTAPAMLALKAAVLKAFVAGAALGTLVTASVNALIAPERAESSSLVAAAPAARDPAAAIATSNRYAPENPAPAALAPNELGKGSGVSVEAQNAGRTPLDQGRNTEPTRAQADPLFAPPAGATAVATFSVDVPGSVKAQERENLLKQEAAIVERAHGAIRRGDLAAAYAALEEARTRFPKGALAQEREAMMIDLLAQSGSKPAARARAEKFLREHPTSPYAQGVRNVAE